MPCTAVKQTQPNCTIVVKETNKSGKWTLPASTPMSTDRKPYRRPPRDYGGCFQLFQIDQMHGITTAQFISSRGSASRSRQIDVCLVQNVRRYRRSNSVHACPCQASHSRNVVQRRTDKSLGERLSHCPDARSLAFCTKDQYLVQRVY